MNLNFALYSCSCRIIVLVLLLVHNDQMGCSSLFLKAGTSKHPRYIPVHEIRRQIPFNQVSAIFALLAITGCDSVSQFAGHSMKSTLRVFQKHHKLLFGRSEDTANSTEKCICTIYGLPDVDTCD